MFIVAAASSFIVIAALLIQLIWVRRFLQLYKPRSIVQFDQASAPKIAIILCVRGVDPSLESCLRGIFTQKYSNYDVKIMLDHPDDPARPLIERVIVELGANHASIHVVANRLGTCALKLNALVEAIESLDDSYRAVALIDADVQAYPEWLQDLTAPLSEPGVGGVNGVRWFVPMANNPGTLIRYLWNAGAVTQMAAFGIPWAGSLVLSRDAIRRSGLLEIWRHALCDDVSIVQAFAPLSLRMVPIGRVTMTCRETVSWLGCFQFVTRQLLVARLHHPRWRSILAFGVLVSLALLASLTLAVVAILTRSWNVAIVSLSTLIVDFVGLSIGLWAIERYIQSLQVARGQPGWRVPWQAFACLPFAQIFHLAALIAASCMPRVTWRGITYEIRGPSDVRVVEYRPFSPTTGDDASLI